MHWNPQTMLLVSWEASRASFLYSFDASPSSSTKFRLEVKDEFVLS